MKNIIMAVATVFALGLSAYAVSNGVPTHQHSGGTDSNGCHTNHKTGEYHCH